MTVSNAMVDAKVKAEGDGESARKSDDEGGLQDVMALSQASADKLAAACEAVLDRYPVILARLTE